MDIPRTWRLRDQRYLLQGTVCSDCGQHSFPPVMVCGSCRGRNQEPYRFSGRGTVYSYAVMYQSPVQFESYIPYVVALIDLAEGPRVTAQLSDVAHDDVEIGMPVEVVVRKISEDGDRGVIAYGYKFRPVLR